MAKKNAPVEAQVVPAGYVPALKKVYKEEIVEKLTKQFSYTTVMQVPPVSYTHLTLPTICSV